MAHSRVMSAMKATVNVAVRWALALGVQFVAFPVVGLQATVSQHLALSGVSTWASLLRGYALRHVSPRVETSGG